MWWIQLESNNKLILIKNGSPVLKQFSLSFIVAVRALHDGTGRKIQVSFDDGSSLQLSLDDFIPKSTSLMADMKASDFAKQFTKEFAGQLREASETNSQLPEKPKSRFKIKKKHIFAACFGGVLAVVAAPVVLTAVGFTSVGIAAESFAAGMMSTAAIANGGGIAAGSAVAVLQSVGAAGLGAVGTAAVGGAGAAVGAGASGLIDAVGDKISSKK